MTQLKQESAPRFSAEDVAFFAENGYLRARGLLDDPTRERMLAATRRDLERLVEPIEFEAELHYPGAPASLNAVGGKTVRRLKTAHERDPVYLEFVRRADVLDRLKQLLGPAVVMPTAHHNCVMTKHPRYSSDTGWHQDIRYWRFERPELVTMWIALGEERPENGCLKVIPGSHKRLYEQRRLDDEQFLRTDLPENRELVERETFVALDPGDVLFFHCRTFHAATRNYSDRTKYSAVFTFRSADNAPIPGTRSDSMPEIVLTPPE